MAYSDALGVDLGIKNMAVCSNGKTYHNFNRDKQVTKLENRIKYLQRRRSKKLEYNRQGEKYVITKNIEKLTAKISKLQANLANYRQNARHQFTHEIAMSKTKTIAIEDLHVKGMVSNHKLAKQVSNIGFAEIRRQLEYKSVLYGFDIIPVDKYYPSTQLCSECGQQTGPKGFDGLKIRTWTCSSCGCIHDRDINAAKNIETYISGSVCQIKSLGSLKQTQVVSEKAETMKQVSRNIA